MRGAIGRAMRWATGALVAALSITAAQAQVRVLDDFRDAGRWQAQASDQVRAAVESEPGRATCLRYDFAGVSGYAVARRALALSLPPHYRLRVTLRGEGGANALQLKLVDASGENVWWRHWPDFVPPARATTLTIRQRRIEFAWGPTADRTLREAAALELVVASGKAGGAGRVCFEQLAIEALPAPPASPAVRLTEAPGLTTLDLGAPTELNGLSWTWADPARAHDARVALSDDGRRWREVHRFGASRRPRPVVWLPDEEARFVRVRSRGRITALRAMSPREWPDRNAMLATLAADAPRSAYPRGFHGEQGYWTLVGVDGGGAHAALIGEDGAVEPARGGPSIAPLVLTDDGQALGWADVESTTSLREGYLPQPQVRWTHPRFALAIDAGAAGTPADARLVLRYTLANPLPRSQRLTLALLLRPWQVNPPSQFLNTPGGISALRSLRWEAGSAPTLHVDGRPWLRAAMPPARVLGAAFDDGEVLGPAARALGVLDDPHGLASVRLEWPLELAAGETRSVSLVLPLAGALPATLAPEADLDAAAREWRERLNRVRFLLPPAAQPLHDSLRSALAQMLMSRDGAALQPGTRSYARSWIRDGAMMVAGLLRLGETDAARAFVDWYASKLFANGKVPCCVDARGADPVAENDSHGQFIVAVALLWRHQGDSAWLRTLWPKVDAAARYMDGLRRSELGQPAPLRGLMPASISHEGYSAKPMHSHWDNFWAWAGWREAEAMARALDLAARADELAAQRAAFGGDLSASIAATMAAKRIDHLPGAAELGDFDPTSSSVIFSPAGAESLVPDAALRATWERYWVEAERRRGSAGWKDYTPYEWRNVSALVRLGQPGRAHAMIDFFFRDQRPAGWNQWAEVVFREARVPGFIGDMPHAWVASDFVRAALDLLAYERDRDGALVLGAGIPESWLREAPVGLDGLGTPWGRLGFTLSLQEGRPRLTLATPAPEPPGGLWLSWRGTLYRVPDGVAQWSPPPP